MGTCAGGPYLVRHFLGIWVVGSLIGTTLDVDLVTFRSRGIVHILVGMASSTPLDKQTDPFGPFLGTACMVKLKEYTFIFCREASDFSPDSEFVPYF